MQPHENKEMVLKNIQVIYEMALEKKSLGIALRAMELTARLQGMFSIQQLPEVKPQAEFTEKKSGISIDQMKKYHPKSKGATMEEPVRDHKEDSLGRQISKDSNLAAQARARAQPVPFKVWSVDRGLESILPKTIGGNNYPIACKESTKWHASPEAIIPPELSGLRISII